MIAMVDWSDSPELAGEWMSIRNSHAKCDTQRRISVRRVVDVIGALVFILLLSPLMLLIALFTFLSNGSPLLYKQVRVGLNGRLFTIWKIRTMKRQAEPYGPELSRPDDPRVTAFGRMLRKSHLDEIPQFWNVLKGDMTLVSYRPERPFYVAQILKKNPKYLNLFSVKPGLTSIGVLDYGYASTIDELVERSHIDIRYLSNRTPGSDCRQIFKTVRNIVGARGT